MPIWDPVRLSWVSDTPEERVRQKIIRKMIQELGYPKGLLSIEKELQNKRRFDLVCYAQGKEGVFPLLLVECKAHTIDAKAIEQARGYNSLIQAPFLCLVSQQAVQTQWREQDKIVSIPFLPLYADLLSRICL